MTREAERWVAEPAKATDTDRSPYQRDRARVLHSAALRRLAAKTQVVGVGEDDFPRTRLTHSLECAQVGRELASALGADPDVVDAACLAHDLGHPPFGHNGETALALAAEPCGGFEGNAQSLRILTRLEAKVLDADGRSAGLNLTRAVLDAATKYPWPRREGTTSSASTPTTCRCSAGSARTRRATGACVEAQVMDWADDVAYSVHDLEDGIHSGQVPLHKVDVDAVVHLAALTGCASTPDLDELYQELSVQPWWVHGYDGTLRAQAAVKRMTSELTARLTELRRTGDPRGPRRRTARPVRGRRGRAGADAGRVRAAQGDRRALRDAGPPRGAGTATGCSPSWSTCWPRTRTSSSRPWPRSGTRPATTRRGCGWSSTRWPRSPIPRRWPGTPGSGQGNQGQRPRRDERRDADQPERDLAPAGDRLVVGAGRQLLALAASACRQAYVRAYTRPGPGGAVRPAGEVAGARGRTDP